MLSDTTRIHDGACRILRPGSTGPVDSLKMQGKSLRQSHILLHSLVLNEGLDLPWVLLTTRPASATER